MKRLTLICTHPPPLGQRRTSPDMQHKYSAVLQMELGREGGAGILILFLHQAA